MTRALPILLAFLYAMPTLARAADTATTQPVLVDSKIGLRLYKPAEPADGTSPYSLILETKRVEVPERLLDPNGDPGHRSSGG